MSDKNSLTSLRDQFAIAALASGLGQGAPEQIADRAYQIADAMVRRSKSLPKAEAAPMAAPAAPRAAMTIEEFCEASGGISKSYFHKLVNEGSGPRLMKVGRRTFVTAESAAEWRRAQEGRNG